MAQRAMGRAMLWITMRDRHRSTWIRAKTGVKGIVQVVKKQKWRWAGHVARMNDKRWTKKNDRLLPIKEAEREPTLDGEMTEMFAGKNMAKMSSG